MRTKIDWLNHTLEFLVVLVGILIAFQLDRCNTQNQQARLLDNHLAYLNEEVNDNSNNLKKSIEHAKKINANLDTLLLLIQEKGNINRINGLTFELLDIGGVYLQKNAYSTLVQSGDIRFFKDFDLKKQTVQLYEFYKYVESMEEIGLKSYTDDYYPYVKKHLDMVYAKPQDRSIYSTKAFINALGSYKYMVNSRQQKYDQALKFTEKYLKLVGDLR